MSISEQEKDITISYYVEEIEHQEENNFNIEKMMAEIDKIDNTEIQDYDLMIPQIFNYNENYTVKQLLMICEYYGFLKDIKTNKFNKEQIIDFLVSFECDPNNSDIVCKRQNMWFYMNELKNDKFMKKFVLW
jgi:hypothetical protein